MASRPTSSPNLQATHAHSDNFPSPTAWNKDGGLQSVKNSINPAQNGKSTMPNSIDLAKDHSFKSESKTDPTNGIKEIFEIDENDGMKLLERSERERNEIEKEMESLRKEDEVLQSKIIELIEHAEKFEKDHDANLLEINVYENQLLEIQSSLKQIQDRKEMYERKLEHMRNFSVLNEAFNIEINDQIGKINGLELGLLSGEKEPNWVHINSAFGNIMLIYSYLIKVNGVENEGSYPVEVCAFGYNSYFNDTNVGKKYFLMGPVTNKNLVGLLGKLQHRDKIPGHLHATHIQILLEVFRRSQGESRGAQQVPENGYRRENRWGVATLQIR